LSKKIKALAKKRKKKSDHIKYANPRMRKLVSELASGKPPVEAGLTAGYSENYCKTRLYSMMRRSNSFAQLVEQQAKHSVALIQNLYKINLLPRSFSVDERMISKFEENPELAMKHPQVITRIHRVAGILEDRPLIQHVNIGVLNQLQVTQENLLEGLVADKPRESSFEDGNEVIEVEGKVIR
jgi:hypothetical protein